MIAPIIPDISQASGWLPLFFLVAMGIAVLSYVVLDGYDLGVGILLHQATDDEKDMMISSIGPFWDANETWLVLGVGLLLVAFPLAHGIILTELYIPVAIMLAGLILRGVSFDFRVKVQSHQKPLWNFLFYLGSLIASIAQGVMIGRHIVGFDAGLLGWLFAFIVGACVPAGYALLGSTWLIMKSEGDLQTKAIRWARMSLGFTALGIGLISITTPFFSPEIMGKWFSMPNLIYLSPIPIATLLLFIVIERTLHKLTLNPHQKIWLPFVASVAIYWLAFFGIAYSLFPYIIVNQMTIWQAAASTESLWLIFWGTVFVLPAILIYTLYSYRVFWGKTVPMSYY
ncbi:cytochrome d ubiquinol oxidase subunit II [Polynucleobacter sp. AP-Titi-500A-B4]|uniref:cytochrome d ubiquinol oxidase subunit II n=1 Tax=Polynucleobacter sp. AP-Titi-500A-B4 TaxID=2576923 RepID=UPI001BFE15F0|nr:cytochrome d ubiquinol oxidase subunit II [Polynucleobacter sp. AP-Titi-500A-B4]QWE12111.1 cytochrome d ubiquinol oxidase subunit II [Polynucleobacter sp. AP-Titi-500A-B4]